MAERVPCISKCLCGGRLADKGRRGGGTYSEQRRDPTVTYAAHGHDAPLDAYGFTHTGAQFFCQA
jgi:hypothetical protein